MRTLRLFINNDLVGPVNWALVNDDASIETGATPFAELSVIEDVTLEVYLSSACCSIFKTSVVGISTKHMTEELVLGLIEDNLADEIDDVKAIILRVEDDIVYVAVFNRMYYESLMNLIHGLDKPIRFIQSFAFATKFNETSWTVYLSQTQRFLRTSQYEYYSLDDNKPLPNLLEDLLLAEKPKSLLIYAEADAGYNAAQIAELSALPYTDLTGQYEYGTMVWNFHIQTSTRFNIKLDKTSKASLKILLKSTKYLFVFLILFWTLDILMLVIDGYRINSQIKNNLQGVVAANTINRTIMQTASSKINMLRHQRGIYDDKDAVVILTKFLQIVSTVTQNDIKQVEYNNGEMQIILGSNFDSSQFVSYQDVLETRQLVATIEDYKSYAKKNKKNEEAANNNINAQEQVIDDAQWVVTLKPALWHEAIRTKQ